MNQKMSFSWIAISKDKPWKVYIAGHPYEGVRCSMYRTPSGGQDIWW